MQPIDTERAATANNPTDGGLTTPAFRQELQETAPHLVNRFDLINGRRHNHAGESSTQNRTTALSDESRHDIHLNRSPTLSIDSDFSTPETLVNSIPSTGVSIELSDPPQVATRAARRTTIFDSDPRNNPTWSNTGIRSYDSARNDHSQRSSNGKPGNDGTPGDNGTRSNNGTSSIGTRSETSSASDRRSSNAIKASEAILTMRIQIRLVPVIHLLTAADSTHADRLRARKLAHEALDYAKQCGTSLPLVARCSFYLAHTYYDQQDSRYTETAVNWFQRATDASEAGYPEGQWAQEWLNRYESVNMAADSRPLTAGSASWPAGTVNSVWNRLTRSQSNSSSPISPAARVPRGERVPSFSTTSSSSSSSSATAASSSSADTRDHHSLEWFPNSTWGKRETLPGQRFELVQSPEPIDGLPEDEEQHMPANVLGDLVGAGALSPTVQRLPRHQPYPAAGHGSDYYVPPGPRNWRIANQTTSPPGSPSFTGSSPQHRSSSYFANPASQIQKPHTRTQPFALPRPSSSLPVSSQIYVQSEHPSSLTSSALNKTRNSLSLVIRATSFDGHRKRDEAAQMKEGQTPAFALEGTRSSDVLGEGCEV
jgi:hypothetical protein